MTKNIIDWEDADCPDMDENGYPTDGTLQAIIDMPMYEFKDMARFVASAWNVDYGSFYITADSLVLITGGWSGNESIISAMKLNMLLWALFWYRSTRGGRFEFNSGKEQL